MEHLQLNHPIMLGDQLNNWLYETIKPFLRSQSLEIDSGLETLSSTFVQNNRPIHLNNPNQAIRHQLKSKYLGIESIQSVTGMDFHRSDFKKTYPERRNVFDMIIAFNAIDNERFNALLIQNAIQLLKDRGRLAILVPTHTTLYHGLDNNLADWTKYNGKEISHLLSNTMEIIMTHFFITSNLLVYQPSGLTTLVIARKIGSVK
jgi:hypothetical protein